MVSTDSVRVGRTCYCPASHLPIDLTLIPCWQGSGWAALSQLGESRSLGYNLLSLCWQGEGEAIVFFVSRGVWLE